MHVWLYVKIGVARTGPSVLNFCRSHEFSWIQGGPFVTAEEFGRNKKGPKVLLRAPRGTLRRRYYEAVKFLESESKPYRDAWKMGIRSKSFGETSPMEAWWQRELTAALARK